LLRRMKIGAHADRRNKGQTYFSFGSKFLHASINPFTATTDLSNMARSSSVRFNSTIRSIPSAPITAGTPTYMPSRPYLPSI